MEVNPTTAFGGEMGRETISIGFEGKIMDLCETNWKVLKI